MRAIRTYILILEVLARWVLFNPYNLINTLFQEHTLEGDLTFKLENYDWRIAPQLVRFANIKSPEAIEVWINKR